MMRSVYNFNTLENHVKISQKLIELKASWAVPRSSLLAKGLKWS